MNVARLWLGGLLVTLAVAGAAAQSTFRLSRDEYPIVDGSTSTQPLGMVIAGRVTSTSVEWRRTSFFEGTRRVVPTDTPYDPSSKLSLEPMPAESRASAPLAALVALGPLAERTRHTGTHESYVRLAAGEVALVLTAREPTPDERAAVKRGGAEIVVRPVARDAFVFLRNAANPVKSLTLDQVRDIYSGAITNWKDVGGPDQPIKAYRRDATSGSEVEMEQLVMRGRPMREGPDIRIAMTMFGPFNAIRHDPTGIGYSYHYYERFMASVPEVATIAVNGVPPEPATIGTGRYPLVTFVYLAHRADLSAGSAARLRDWLLTPAGQAVIAESGYLPLAR